MKNTRVLTAIGGLAVVFVGAGVAAQNRVPQVERPVNRLAAALDTDRDGTISKAEIGAASAALETIDTNGDGRLTIDEIRPSARPGGGRGARGAASAPPRADAGPGRAGRGGGPVLRALDADGNGALSGAELSRATEALKALDANADGQVSVDELRPERRRAFGERERSQERQ
jgi:hypothetical protein